MEYKWEAGQMVILHAGASWEQRRSIKTVERFTPKGNIVVDGTVFTVDGYQRGGQRFHESRIEPATKALMWEVRQENRKALARYKVNIKITKDLSLSQLERILNILEEK